MSEHAHRYAKEATYYYTTPNGDIRYRKVKRRCECGAKTFVNQRRIGSRAFANGLGGIEKLPYNLGPVSDAVAEGHPIWVVEGEKDVETLRDLGEIGTCSPDGARSWSHELAKYLYGAVEVRIVADQDTPGRRYASFVRTSLAGSVGRTATFAPAAGKDLTDHVQAGYSLADLVGASPIATGIAAGLAPQFARAGLRPDDSRLPVPDEFPIPDRWVTVSTRPPADVRSRILNAEKAQPGQRIEPHAVPVICSGCGAFLMVEIKPGAGRTCHRCRVTYETWSDDQ